MPYFLNNALEPNALPFTPPPPAAQKSNKYHFFIRRHICCLFRDLVESLASKTIKNTTQPLNIKPLNQLHKMMPFIYLENVVRNTVFIPEDNTKEEIEQKVHLP